MRQVETSRHILVWGTQDGDGGVGENTERCRNILRQSDLSWNAVAYQNPHKKSSQAVSPTIQSARLRGKMRPTTSHNQSFFGASGRPMPDSRGGGYAVGIPYMTNSDNYPQSLMPRPDRLLFYATKTEFL